MNIGTLMALLPAVLVPFIAFAAWAVLEDEDVSNAVRAPKRKKEKRLPRIKVLRPALPSLDALRKRTRRALLLRSLVGGSALVLLSLPFVSNGWESVPLTAEAVPVFALMAVLATIGGVALEGLGHSVRTLRSIQRQARELYRIQARPKSSISYQKLPR